MTTETTMLPVTGRCYCGATHIRAETLPTDISYCHCSDCRRVTGAPVAAFAAFENSKVTFLPDEGRAVTVTPGVRRTFCESCGSPISGRFDYLPNTVYIALGLLDQADALPPELHAHASNRLVWLHIDDDLERHDKSARARLIR
uniref:GFA family protein n=1 Tax=Pararhizobium sp. IMCC3301 TaxID=3067904 RepID=UPI0035322D7B